MTVRVTLDVFSGRPNPTVELDGEEADDLLDRLRPEGRLQVDDIATPPVLGYRGIVVEQDERSDQLPRQLRLIEGRAFGVGLAHTVRDREVEDYLISEDGPFRELPIDIEPGEFHDRVRQLRDDYLKLEWRHKWPWWDDVFVWPWPTPCKCGPLYEPAWWNAPSRRPHNNCYNYACNYRTDTFAQPGRAHSAQYSSLTCDSVRPAAVADKLIDAPKANNGCPEEGHLVALVVAPGWDFHWYRKGRDGWWSHKPGSTPATNLDNSGKLIVDPRSADRGSYTDFCTFMVVMHGHIKIE